MTSRFPIKVNSDRTLTFSYDEYDHDLYFQDLLGGQICFVLQDGISVVHWISRQDICSKVGILVNHCDDALFLTDKNAEYADFELEIETTYYRGPLDEWQPSTSDLLHALNACRISADDLDIIDLNGAHYIKVWAFRNHVRINGSYILMTAKAG